LTVVCRLYFKLGKPIDTAALKMDLKDGAAVAKLYKDVRVIVEQVRGLVDSKPASVASVPTLEYQLCQWDVTLYAAGRLVHKAFCRALDTCCQKYVSRGVQHCRCKSAAPIT
jgi:hypothetical protein